MAFRGGIAFQSSESRQFGSLNLRFAIDEGKEKKVDGVGAGNFSWNP